RFADASWQVLGATIAVLRVAAAQLDVVFAARGVSDFAGIAQAAQRALGSADQPTDLLLSLDARIRHLLIDEFQDTSATQFELIEQLTLGWSDGDGRTLFLVGDPMQSIYRFREAEVALFLRARSHGIGAIRLESLALSTNFRSVPAIVDWVNASFAQVFPKAEDELTGAVPLERACAWNGPAPHDGVTLHPLVAGESADEAARVVTAIRAARDARPGASVAVLVRARSHLAEIVPALRADGWPIRAVEIEALAERPVVIDLLSLTRAVRHPADRVAWLSVLRAPWCGLTLAELHALAGDAEGEALWLRINDPVVRPLLSEDGQTRLRCVAEALAPLLADARRASLRDLVEAAWLRLGGPDCLRAPRDLEDANAYLALLAEVEQAGDLADLDVLEQRVTRLFAAPDPVNADGCKPIEVMTIHKAKGLEWDVVILPGLGRVPRADEARLLRWLSWPGERGMRLLMGAIAARGGARDRTHAWIERIEKMRTRIEIGRLLYVAATRARWQLHLLGSASHDRKGEGLVTPSRSTLLGQLWPAVAAQFVARLTETALSTDPDTTAPSAADVAPAADQSLDRRTFRLPPGRPLDGTDARLPVSLALARTQLAGERLLIEFSWAGETVRVVGTVVHRWLQQIASDFPAWTAARVRALAPLFERELAAAGVPVGERPFAVNRAIDALTGSLVDTRGRWVLGPRDAEAEAASEWKLTGLDGGQCVNVAIDRSFIDAGVRWVIDYKTGSHEGGDRDAFMDREVERYRAQLARYARLLLAIGPQPIRCGLYFPLMAGWREFDA
ncbi:MAG: UvrD-helicase domain-containing protein, partial [Betaproteobacteria bacterium]